MKFALVTLFAFLAVANARIIQDQIDLEDITAYNYLAKIGLPLAEAIRKSEAEEMSRIVGGTQVSEATAYPYQVGLLAQFGQGQGVCGGSLISDTRVVTAAHCWFDGQNQATSITVVLGTIRLFSGGTRLTTNQVVMHSNWMPNLIRNDVAIINLLRGVTFSNTIRPIALPSGSLLNSNYAGETAVASGYGLTSDDGQISTGQVLSHVELPIITNNVCSFSFPFLVQNSNICTSGAGGRSTCRGDSGGPLAVLRNGQPLLVGITSFGSGRGCTVGYPAVFARITSFIDFITQN